MSQKVLMMAMLKRSRSQGGNSSICNRKRQIQTPLGMCQTARSSWGRWVVLRRPSSYTISTRRPRCSGKMQKGQNVARTLTKPNIITKTNTSDQANCESKATRPTQARRTHKLSNFTQSLSGQVLLIHIDRNELCPITKLKMDHFQVCPLFWSWCGGGTVYGLCQQVTINPGNINSIPGNIIIISGLNNIISGNTNITRVSTTTWQVSSAGTRATVEPCSSRYSTLRWSWLSKR